jgi:hypothetical protein
MRLNDRVDAEGKKMLLIEEVQSDWHQAGREKGYALSDKEKIRADEIMKMADKAGGIKNLSSELQAEGKELGRRLTQNETVPDAPFKDTWHQLALKRAIKEAVDKGYDRIGLTTGKQQAARYDLSKQVDDLNVFRNEDGTFSIKATLMSDQSVQDVGKQIQPEKLSEFVGKDLAEQMLQQKSGTKKYYSGEDLKVGGEGMKKYYDEIYPNYLNKLGKKYGAQVGETKVNTGIDNLPAGSSVPTMKQEPVRYLDITPEMRKAVKAGQPLASITNHLANAMA